MNQNRVVIQDKRGDERMCGRMVGWTDICCNIWSFQITGADLWPGQTHLNHYLKGLSEIRSFKFQRIWIENEKEKYCNCHPVVSSHNLQMYNCGGSTAGLKKVVEGSEYLRTNWQSHLLWPHGTGHKVIPPCCLVELVYFLYLMSF